LINQALSELVEADLDFGFPPSDRPWGCPLPSAELGVKNVFFGFSSVITDVRQNSLGKYFRDAKIVASKYTILRIMLKKFFW